MIGIGKRNVVQPSAEVDNLNIHNRVIGWAKANYGRPT